MPRKRQTQPGPYLREVQLVRKDAKLQQYPWTLPALRDLERLPLHDKVTFLVGENGSGKSTLLEAIAVACDLNPEGGSRNFNFSTRASHSLLGDHMRLVRHFHTPRDSYFLRAESFFNVATEIERLDEEGSGPPIIGAYGGTSLHEQSHGESFFALFKNRFGTHGLYLMDEPEAALSPKRQFAFLRLLHDYLADGCQFIIATHSPIILAYPEATIYQLDETGITVVPYTETDHFVLTRHFLTHRDKMLRDLGVH